MILILHANCIIYIWRICDLPLCRHIQTKHASTWTAGTLTQDTCTQGHIVSMYAHNTKHATRIHTVPYTRILAKDDCAILRQSGNKSTREYSSIAHVFTSRPPVSTATALVYEQLFARSEGLRGPFSNIVGLKGKFTGTPRIQRQAEILYFSPCISRFFTRCDCHLMISL